MRCFLLLLLVLGLLTPGATLAQPPTWWWAKSCGFGTVTAAVADGTGDTYIAGHFEGLAGFDTTMLQSAGGYDLFVAKLAYDGFCEWAVRAGGPADETVTALALDATGRLVVAGEFAGAALTLGSQTLSNSGSGPAFFVARLTLGRTWQQAAGASGAGAAEAALTGLALDAAGNAYVTGTTTHSTLTFGSNLLSTTGQYGDAFVAKLGANGAWQWAHGIGGDSAVAGLAVAASPAGDVYLTGSFSGGTATVGTTTLSGAYEGAAFLAHLNTAGAWQEAEVIGAPGARRATGVVVDTAGDVVVVGAYAASAVFRRATTNWTLTSVGDLDTFVAKWSPATGFWRWASSAGGTGPDVPTAVKLNVTGVSLPTNDIFLTGTFASPTAAFGGTLLHHTATGGTPESGDVFAARLTDTGFWLWGVQTGSTVANRNVSHDLAIDYLGQAVVVGSFLSSTFTLGSTTFTNPSIVQPRSFFGRIAHQGPSGVAVLGGTALTLTPNPAHRTVRLTDSPATTATLLDAVGRTVRTWAVPASGELDLTGLAPGLYSVRAGALARRLVVE